MRRYRPPASQLVASLICSALLVLLALSALAEPWHRVGVWGVITSVAAGGIGCITAALRLTVDVTLTPVEISYRYNFRRRTIPWASVEAFRVGRTLQRVSWPCVVVHVRSGGRVRLPLAGRRRYVIRMIAEFETYRAQLGAQMLNTKDVLRAGI